MASKLLNIMTMMLKEIETRLQSASGSHERSYRVTQGRVESLAAERVVQELDQVAIVIGTERTAIGAARRND